jgi:hypothetical protein
MPTTLLDLPSEILLAIWSQVFSFKTFVNPTKAPCACPASSCAKGRLETCNYSLPDYLLLCRRLYPVILQSGPKCLSLSVKPGLSDCLRFFTSSNVRPGKWIETASLTAPLNSESQLDDLALVRMILFFCPKLRRLCLDSVIRGVDPSVLASIYRSLSDFPVTSLEIALLSKRHEAQSGIWQALEHFKQLSTLELGGSRSSAPSSPSLSSVKTLRLMPISSLDSRLFKVMPHLTDLYFTSSSTSQDAWQRLLEELPARLEKLSFEPPLPFNSTPSTFASLKRLKRLSHFSWTETRGELHGSIVHLLDNLSPSIISIEIARHERSVYYRETSYNRFLLAPSRFVTDSYLPNLRQLEFSFGFVPEQEFHDWDEVCSKRGIHLVAKRKEPRAVSRCRQALLAC